MADEPKRGLDEMADEMAEDTRTLGEGLEAEMTEDLAKAKGEGGPPKRPWWKVWART
jgi:hypothetical protein